MDLRLLNTTQHLTQEQKQLFRLSAPLCPQQNYQVVNDYFLITNDENRYISVK